jgi:hypothetical protein
MTPRTDFAGDNGWFAVTSPNAGFGIGVAWNTDVHPHAWWWQEIHGTAEHPSFRRAYVIAVEPANVLTAAGFEPPVLAAHQQWSSAVTFVRLLDLSPVRHISLDGAVTQGSSA